MKKKKMYINLIKFNSTKLISLKELIARVIFLHFIYIIVYSTMNVMIENVIIKTMFNNKVEINRIFK